MAGTKNLKRNASRVESDDEDTILSTKKTKTVNALGNGTDKDGNPYWELANKRRVGVSKFNGMTMVNIREYYEKDGELLPGKKGISLSLPQYEALVNAIPQISVQLQAMGHAVEDSEDAGGAPTQAEAIVKPKKSKKASKKANIEATSDEDEED